MSRWPLWAVLAPGEPARLERRARAIVMTKEDGTRPPFELIRGTGRYHAIVSTDLDSLGAEVRLAKKLSLECDELVYSIERAVEPWTVMSWRSGAVDVLEAPLSRSCGGCYHSGQVGRWTPTWAEVGPERRTAKANSSRPDAEE